MILQMLKIHITVIIAIPAFELGILGAREIAVKSRDALLSQNNTTVSCDLSCTKPTRLLQSHTSVPNMILQASKEYGVYDSQEHNKEDKNKNNNNKK